MEQGKLFDTPKPDTIAHRIYDALRAWDWAEHADGYAGNNEMVLNTYAEGKVQIELKVLGGEVYLSLRISKKPIDCYTIYDMNMGDVFNNELTEKVRSKMLTFLVRNEYQIQEVISKHK